MLQRLRRANLKLSSKGTLFQHEVSFPGLIVGRSGRRTDPQKVETMQLYSVPSSVADLWKYLCLSTYYRRFVRDFATVTTPFYQLKRKGARFH